MGEYSHFRFGQKAPNNGTYREIGETGSNVKDPKIIKLKAGEKFPENSNHDRVWTNESKELVISRIYKDGIVEISSFLMLAYNTPLII